MNHGIRTITYPVKDLAQAKTVYSALLGVAPYTDEAYYVGLRKTAGLDYLSGARPIDDNGRAQHRQGSAARTGAIGSPSIQG